jgi:hypothetical protein
VNISTLCRHIRQEIKETETMKLVRRLLLAVVLAMAVAPVIGLADNPVPECFPCP